MSNASKSRTHTGHGVLAPLLSLLAATLTAGCLHVSEPMSAGETGIRGTVLRGPVHGGPMIAGQAHEAPFRASFSVTESRQTVALFESNEDGVFEVALPPGEYTIVPDTSAPILFPQRQQKTVTVPEDGFATVTLRFDTGLR